MQAYYLSSRDQYCSIYCMYVCNLAVYTGWLKSKSQPALYAR